MSTSYGVESVQFTKTAPCSHQSLKGSKSQRLKVSKNQADVAVEISAGGRDPF